MEFTARLKARIHDQELACGVVEEKINHELHKARMDAAEIHHVNAAISSYSDFWQATPQGVQSLHELDIAALRNRGGGGMDPVETHLYTI